MTNICKKITILTFYVAKIISIVIIIIAKIRKDLLLHKSFQYGSIGGGGISVFS